MVSLSFGMSESPFLGKMFHETNLFQLVRNHLGNDFEPCVDPSGKSHGSCDFGDFGGS